MSDELDFDSILNGLPQARQQHYMFAHMALPRVVLSLHPKEADLARRAGDLEMFRRMWADLAQLIEDEPISDEGFAATHVEKGGMEALILTLPKAEIPSEAIMVAIVRLPVRRWLVLPGHELRYFTLELGLSFTDDYKHAGYRTVLCEWADKGNRHLNHGDGPPADVAAFAETVFEKCRGQ